MNKALSKTFDFLRFPLAVLVVYLHIDAMPLIKVLDFNWCNSDGSPIYYAITILIVKIASLAVPCFFVISGYRLFNSLGKLSLAVYGQKIRKRIKTLVIPYIIWNILAMIYLYITQDIEPKSWQFVFLSPANFPLWFMRDLIVMTFLFPLFYWGIKLLGGYITIILGFLYLGNFIFHVGVCYFSSIFFFYIGCYCGYKHILPINVKSLYGYILVYWACLGIDFILYGTALGLYWNRLYLIVGVFTVFVACYNVMIKHNIRVIPLLSSASFFIYLVHKLGFTYVSKIIFNYLPSNYYVKTLQFLIAPCIAVALCLGVYYLIKKYFPKLLFITGGK